MKDNIVKVYKIENPELFFAAPIGSYNGLKLIRTEITTGKNSVKILEEVAAA